MYLFLLTWLLLGCKAEISKETEKLVNDWAPLIWIHPEDPFYPSNVDYHLANMEVILKAWEILAHYIHQSYKSLYIIFIYIYSLSILNLSYIDYCQLETLMYNFLFWYLEHVYLNLFHVTFCKHIKVFLSKYFHSQCFFTY